jgi:hypothetical protein
MWDGQLPGAGLSLRGAEYLAALSERRRSSALNADNAMGQVDVLALECAARGRTVRADYPNGDRFGLHFQDINDADQLLEKYPSLTEDSPRNYVGYPVSVLEVHQQTVNAAFVDFGPERTILPARNTFMNSWSIDSSVGFQLNGVSPLLEELLFSQGTSPRGPDDVFYLGTCDCTQVTTAVRRRGPTMPSR